MSKPDNLMYCQLNSKRHSIPLVSVFFHAIIDSLPERSCDSAAAMPLLEHFKVRDSGSMRSGHLLLFETNPEICREIYINVVERKVA